MVAPDSHTRTRCRAEFATAPWATQWRGIACGRMLLQQFALVLVAVWGLSLSVRGNAIPGVIQAENYDAGGEGTAYHDLSPGNLGGQQRSDDVDIYSGGAGGLHVGHVEAGEWLRFTLTSEEDATWAVRYRVASGTAAPIAVRLEVDGVTADVVATSGTSNYAGWKNVSTARPFALAAGSHDVRLVFLAGNMNLDEIAFSLSTGAGPVYLDPTRPIAERVDDLVARMTLNEKVGQTVLIDRRFLATGEWPQHAEPDIGTWMMGGVFSGGGSAPTPNTIEAWADMVDRYQAYALATRLHVPILYGADAVHGQCKLLDATIFPHNIGLGAANDPELVEKVARVVATECAATGVRWTFAPAVSVARDFRWGRTYESLGEAPERVGPLAGAMVRGLVGAGLDSLTGVLPGAKHFVADGGAVWGTGRDGKSDRGDARISENQLRRLHLSPFESAIEGGCLSVMVSFSRWNGGLLHGQRYLITDVLKEEIGFEGFVLSDWAGINDLGGTYRSAIATAINAGIDMIMVPDRYEQYSEECRAAVNGGLIPMARLDDAVRRILTVKFRLGLFERPFTERSLQAAVRSAEHLAIAREAVGRSIVLLKNDGGLVPLPKDLARIHVAGRHGDDVGLQCGGWTVSWQGGSGPTTAGTTILQGMRAAVAPGTSVTYSADGAGAAGADVGIAIVGEEPYAEFFGDNANPRLSASDLSVIANLRAAGVPVVVILVSGRPLLIDAELGKWDALLAAWLPGSEGQGVADVLFGDRPFEGTLPQSWPRAGGSMAINVGDSPYDPLFPFGFGLVSGAPKLSIRRMGDDIVVSWPAAAGAGLELQWAGTVGISAAWSATSGRPVQVGSRYEFREPVSGSSPRFYRLVRP